MQTGTQVTALAGGGGVDITVQVAFCGVAAHDFQGVGQSKLEVGREHRHFVLDGLLLDVRTRGRAGNREPSALSHAIVRVWTTYRTTSCWFK